MGQIPDDDYEGRTDKSCVAVYDGQSDKFVIYNNAFPTMYYEPNVGLCWKINGAKTSMPVRGIPGHDGANGKLNIVKGQLDTSDVTGKEYGLFLIMFYLI